MMRRGPRRPAEAPRPPGWKPAPQPPPGPAAPLIALAPPAVRPAPSRPAPAPVPPPARRGWLFPWLTLWLGFSTVDRVGTVLSRHPSGVVESMVQGVYLGSAGAAVVLTLGLARGDRWLPRAAAIWAASVVARYAIEALGLAGPGETRSFAHFLLAGTIPVCTAMYIQHRARELGLLS